MKILGMADHPLLTREEVVDAFRVVARKTHPDVGGSHEQFVQAQEALSYLLQILPSQDQLLALKQADIQRREERRFAQQEGSGKKNLLGGPRGILSRSVLNVKESIGDALFGAKVKISDYRVERERHKARPPEVTGREMQSAEDAMLAKEMEQIKLDEIRQKGVGRLVEKLIAEAVRGGKFQNLAGKGRPLEEDYYEAHLSTANPLERKLKAIMKDEGLVPEWIELAQTLQEKTEALKKEFQKEISSCKRVQRGPFGELFKIEEYAPLMLQEPEIQTRLKEISEITQRHNMLCPPLLQKTSWSKVWAMELLQEQIRIANRE